MVDRPDPQKLIASLLGRVAAHSIARALRTRDVPGAVLIVSAGMVRLIDCPTCARLIRNEEDACPFCGAAFRPEGTSSSLRAFGLVLGLMTASCSGEKPNDSMSATSGAIYSAPWVTFMESDTGTGTDTSTGTSTGTTDATTGVTDEPPGTASAAYAASSSATLDDSSGTDGTGTATDATGTASTGTGTGTTGSGTTG